VHPWRIFSIALLSLLFVALFVTSTAFSQITGDEFNSLNTSIGQRVETAVILGTANTVTTGGYKWQLDNATGTITRGTWEFEFGDYHPIDLSNIKYIWSTDGGVGYADYTDEFLAGQLEGDNQRFQSYALGSEIGPRVFFTNDISVLPQIGLIYGYTTNTFHDLTGAGADAIINSLVNWQVQTLSVTPSIQAQYEHTFSGVLRLRLRTIYTYYCTFPVQRSTQAWSFRSNSEVWENLIDVDYKTPIQLLHNDLHLGGTFYRTDLFDGISAAMDCSHFYNITGRISFDTSRTLGVLSELGVSANYTWGTGFHGYAIGIIVGVSL
jgi:hypothetical protein